MEIIKYHQKSIKYPKPGRFPIGDGKRKKNMLTKKQVSRLLEGRVVIEEKLDGRSSSFENDRYIVFAEDMKRQHSIFYILPGRYAVFDIFDKKRNVFLYSEEKIELAKALREGKIRIDGVEPILFFPVPQIEKGMFSLEELPKMLGLSAYAHNKKTTERTYMEGIVVKPDRDLFLEEFLSGKLVREEFEEGIKMNYLRLLPQYNIINPSVDVVVYLQQERLRPSKIPPGLRVE